MAHQSKTCSSLQKRQMQKRRRCNECSNLDPSWGCKKYWRSGNCRKSGGLPPENLFEITPYEKSENTLGAKQSAFIFILDPHSNKEKPIPETGFIEVSRFKTKKKRITSTIPLSSRTRTESRLKVCRRTAKLRYMYATDLFCDAPGF